MDKDVYEQKVEATIQSGTKVMQFFCNYHDEKNTIESEVKKIESFRAKVQDKCVCVDYNSKSTLLATLATVQLKQDN